jgi:hypothetical protein
MPGVFPGDGYGYYRAMEMLKRIGLIGVLLVGLSVFTACSSGGGPGVEDGDGGGGMMVKSVGTMSMEEMMRVMMEE